MNDTKKKMSLLCLIACVLISAALCFGQIASSKPVIVMCLVLFLALIVYSVIQDAVFPVLLYFLPWATLLRYQEPHPCIANFRFLSRRQAHKRKEPDS